MYDTKGGKVQMHHRKRVFNSIFTLSTFLKNKRKVLTSDSNRKRARESDNPVDEEIVTWFKEARDKKLLSVKLLFV